MRTAQIAPPPGAVAADTGPPPSGAEPGVFADLLTQTTARTAIAEGPQKNRPQQNGSAPASGHDLQGAADEAAGGQGQDAPAPALAGQPAAVPAVAVDGTQSALGADAGTGLQPAASPVASAPTISTSAVLEGAAVTVAVKAPTTTAVLEGAAVTVAAQAPTTTAVLEGSAADLSASPAPAAGGAPVVRPSVGEQPIDTAPRPVPPTTAAPQDGAAVQPEGEQVPAHGPGAQRVAPNPHDHQPAAKLGAAVAAPQVVATAAEVAADGGRGAGFVATPVAADPNRAPATEMQSGAPQAVPPQAAQPQPPVAQGTLQPTVHADPSAAVAQAVPADHGERGALAAQVRGGQVPTLSPAGTAAAVERIHDLVRIAQLRDGNARATLQLKPAELGTVNVMLRTTADGLVATIRAHDHGALAAIRHAGAELVQSLQDRGVTLARIDVQLAAGGDAAPRERRDQQLTNGGDRRGRGDGHQAAAVADEERELTLSLSTDEPVAVTRADGVLIDVRA